MADTDALVAERGKAYGHPYDNHARIAALWTGLLGDMLNEPIGPHHAALMMDLVKSARLMVTPDHADSMDDKAGYLECYRQIRDEHHRRHAQDMP